MLAKSQPSMVSTARSTTARKVSAGSPAKNGPWAVSEKETVSSELWSPGVTGGSPVAIPSRLQSTSRIELCPREGSVNRPNPAHLNVAITTGGGVGGDGMGPVLASRVLKSWLATGGRSLEPHRSLTPTV